MRLLHICIGPTRIHQINNQSVTTAYLKEPVVGPWRINLQGVEGNEVAVHTDPVYAYARDSYDFWAQRLGTRAQDWRPGTFAENLTFETLAEQDLQLGDVVALGDEVRLVVAGPRVPCFKLCWRLAQPDSFIREFALSGRTGVYFGVLQPGIVKPGDQLRVLERATDSFTVPEVARLIFGDDPPDDERLERALALPTLSATAALALRTKLYRVRDLAQTKHHRWTGWRRFVIDGVNNDAAEILSFRLRAIDGAPLAGFRAGQFLTVRLPQVAGQSETIRTWSCSDYAREPASYRISVKREANGRASQWLHENARAGMELDVRAPSGRFVLDRSGFKPVVLIAAGIGVTPLLAMLKAHLERGDEAPPLYFVHCVRNRRHQPFRDEIDKLIAQRASFHAHYVYSAPEEGDRSGVDYHQAGRFSAKDLYELMKDSHLMHHGRRIDLPWYESDIYICGPTRFQTELRETLLTAGAYTDRVFLEHFAPQAGGSSGAVLEQSQVHFAKSGRVAIWNGEDAPSLLELAEQQGLMPESGCRMGICQACQCKLIEGAVHYDATPLDLPASDVVLACIARPATAKVVLDL